MRPQILPLLAASLLAAPAVLTDVHAAACPPVSVLGKASYAVGTGPVEAVLGDFTGDGVTDIAVTASNYPSGPGSIQVLPGLTSGGVANGTFGSPITTPLSGVPLGIRATDLDGDGRLDLVIGNFGLDAVQVLRGIGAGQFSAPLALPAGSRPYEVLTSDFNGDGVADIAAADNAQNSIQVLIAGRDAGTGRWDGTFAPAVAYPTLDLPLAITQGDFNQDGITDLVCTESFHSTVALFLGRGSGGVGDGTFQAALHVPAGSEPYDLATGDFNEDGRLDLVVAVSNYGGIRVLLGSGTGFFPVTNSYLAGHTCSGVAVADIDEDGIVDLAVTHSVSTSAPDQLQLLRGLGTGGVGSGTFDAPVSLTDCCFPEHVVTGDLDADGHADFVTCDYASSRLGVFLDGCAPPEGPPVITRIRDVPNDQGGKLFITWTASAFDVSGGAVNAYRVWRQVQPGTAAARAVPAGEPATEFRREVRTLADGSSDIVYWEALATLPAQRLAGYGYTAATPQDSVAGSNPLFTYRISALTSNIDVFYDSAPDSGYSVDNLAPAAPSGLVASRSAGAADLSWTASPAADFAVFRLYRSYDPDFVPSEATLIATLAAPGFHDAEGMTASYRLAEVDVHGNVSPFAAALTATTDIAPGGVPGTTWLAPPRPNPVRGTLEVHLALAHATRLSLALYDQQGRRVRTLASGARPAGELTLRWDTRDDGGRAVAAGIYFLRMRADGSEQVRRVSVMR